MRFIVQAAYMELKGQCKNPMEQCFLLTAKAVAAKTGLSHQYVHRLITRYIGKWHRACAKPLLTDLQISRRLKMADKFEAMMEVYGPEWLDNIIFTDESYIQERV